MVALIGRNKLDKSEGHGIACYRVRRSDRPHCFLPGLLQRTEVKHGMKVRKMTQSGLWKAPRWYTSSVLVTFLVLGSFASTFKAPAGLAACGPMTWVCHQFLRLFSQSWGISDMLCWANSTSSRLGDQYQHLGQTVNTFEESSTVNTFEETNPTRHLLTMFVSSEIRS